MNEVFEAIKKEAEARVLSNNDGNQDFLLYLDRKVMQKGESIDIVTEQIEFDQPTQLVFVDDEPGKNFGHRCHYLLYRADTGKFIRKIHAKFPYFMVKKPDTLELVRGSETTERYARKKKLKIALDPAKLSAYLRIAPVPLKFWIRGRRYAILFSGASNGRHVNDLEFLYRTLIDVYGYNANDVYVLNYDGTLNYNKLSWETSPSAGFAPDGSPWRMVVNGQGNRAGFQSVINDLKLRIRPWDCLLIHTNNHGWYDSSGGFLSGYGSNYYASDFAADLAMLPKFKTLLVFMEQCASGSFAAPILSSSPATGTVFQAAVPGDESSAGGWPFDPWAEMWISAMAGVRGDGSPLVVSPDDNLNSLISAWEAYDYAIAIDNPVMSESSVGLSNNVYLCRCRTTLKPMKEWKEFKEIKEFKEPKEIKEVKEPKEIKEVKEPKEALEPKQVFEPKQLTEPKQAMEPKQAFEGPEVEIPHEQYLRVQAELSEGIERLEEVVEKLTPFIPAEQRPVLKPRTRPHRR
jgi:hypothetical protein